MPEVQVNDIEIYYEVHGEGTPLLLIRGWGSSSQRWSPTLLKTLSQQHRLVIFDNRGTGRSSKPDIKYSIEQMADDAAALLTQINIPKVHVVGFSMGGMIAQQFAIKYPERTSSLIVACSNPNTQIVPGSPKVFEVMEMMISPPEDMSQRDIWKRVMPLYSTPEHLEAHGEEMLNAMLNAKTIPTPGYVRRRQLDAINEFSSLERLHLIKAPTLVMHGEKDAWIPFENSKIIAEKIPDARLVLFDKSGHAFIEQQAEMIDAILGFLKEVDA